MGSIRVAPEIIDRAMVVAVDEARHALAVWKGRGRIDVYDLAGSWHTISKPYSQHEEGTWGRSDVSGLVADALSGVVPISPVGPGGGPGVHVDADRLRRARLVRASWAGYALWMEDGEIDVYGRDASHLCRARGPRADIPRASQLMLDLLQVTPHLAA